MSAMNSTDAKQALRLAFDATNIEITSREVLDYTGKESALWAISVTKPDGNHVADGMASTLALAVETTIGEWREKRRHDAETRERRAEFEAACARVVASGKLEGAK